MSKSIKYYVKQRVLPRRVWVARAELYHASRSRACSWGRERSALDDQLISKLVDFSLSSYVKIRRLSQTTLDSVSKAYDGTKTLSYPRLLASLDKGVDADQMKGALYIIGSKSFASFSILNAQFFGSFVLKTLATQDQEKPSIQNLVAKITEDTIVRVAEPSTLKCNLPNDVRDAVVRDVVPRTSLHAAPKELLDAVAAAVESRIAFRDQSLDDLVRLVPLDFTRIRATPDTQTFLLLYGRWEDCLTSPRTLIPIGDTPSTPVATSVLSSDEIDLRALESPSSSCLGWWTISLNFVTTLSCESPYFKTKCQWSCKLTPHPVFQSGR